MSDGSAMNNHHNDHAHLSRGGWLALCTLLGFLAVSIWYAVYSWNALGDVHFSTFGWFALVVGSFVTIAVGGGLMAALFYSNSHHLDR
jgi:hypothetical protein